MAACNAAAPEISDAQRAFISVSEEAESARLGKERAQLKATARLQRRITWLLGGVGAVVAAAVMAVGYSQWDKARQLDGQETVIKMAEKKNAELADSLDRRQFALDHAQANILAELSETKLLRGD